MQVVTLLSVHSVHWTIQTLTFYSHGISTCDGLFAQLGTLYVSRSKLRIGCV